MSPNSLGETGADGAADRKRAVLYSLALTIAANVAAGVLTLAFVNGTTIVETNPYSAVLLQDIGPATLLVHVLEIAILYPLAVSISMAISSPMPILRRSKRIYLFTFSLLVSALPVGASVDLLSDILVISLKTDILAGPQKIITVAFLLAAVFAIAQVKRGWTLGPTPGTAS